MLIKNVSILYGKELEYVKHSHIRISGQFFDKLSSTLIPKRGEQVYDCEGLLVIPGFVNSHTHVGDSIAKDMGLEYGVEKKIHPVIGFKQKILHKTKPSHLRSFIRNSCITMMKNGITTFVDFREGGLDGIDILQKAILNLPIRSIILGRLDYYQSHRLVKKNASLPDFRKTELSKLLQKCDGLGISGPNENSDSILRFYAKSKKLRAIHSSETSESCKTSKKITGKTETQRAMILKPDFLVHMTHASKKDLLLAAKNGTSIVVCPRANASLAEGIPDVNLMVHCGCNITIGTDNVMINSPDMFREMDYLWKVSMAMQKKRISPKLILKMATVNAGNMIKNRKLGSIQRNYLADCIFINKHQIDLEPMHNPYASIVHRASENVIAAVMIGGKIVHGKI